MHGLERGLALNVTRAKARSKVTLVVRVGGKVVVRFTTRASGRGTAKVKFHLSKQLAVRYAGKKLNLRVTVTDAKGHRHTLSRTVKVA